ncbi:MAG: serine acetyltransferase, partial [Desulfobacterales bacterium]|nr:serine acetyltransferase [Desulfobacterales bacterium]
MNDISDAERCKVEVAAARDFRKEIPKVVDDLVLSCEREDCFDHVSLEQLPSRDALIDILERARRILYPGYFFRSRVDRMNLGYYFGQEATAFFEILSEQITLAVRHECLRHDLPCTHCEERGEQCAVLFMK